MLCRQKLFKKLSAGWEGRLIDEIVEGQSFAYNVTRVLYYWGRQRFCVHRAAAAAYVYLCYSVVYEVKAGNSGFIVQSTSFDWIWCYLFVCEFCYHVFVGTWCVFSV